MKKEHKLCYTDTEVFCDFCGGSNPVVTVQSCYGCQKDICDSCARKYYENPFTGDPVKGDLEFNAIFMCETCYELVPPTINIVQLKIKQWRDECRRIGDPHIK